MYRPSKLEVHRAFIDIQPVSKDSAFIWLQTPILQGFVETQREDLQYIKSFQNYSKLFRIFQDLSTFFESQLAKLRVIIIIGLRLQIKCLVQHCALPVELNLTCRMNLLLNLVFFPSLFSFQTGTNIVQYLASTSSCTPHVLMLGEEHRCSQAFVVINGMASEHPSLLGAVDGCFKAFFVLDVNYPKPCAQVWEFIQTGVFAITGHESNAVKLMRSQLAAMESSNTPAS